MYHLAFSADILDAPQLSANVKQIVEQLTATIKDLIPIVTSKHCLLIHGPENLVFDPGAYSLLRDAHCQSSLNLSATM